MLTRALIIATLAVAFVYGVVHLFFLRFESGDVYPEYSSLRADPLGAKGFHDALHELPQLEVRRNYRPVAKLRSAGPITLIYSGASEHAFFDEDELRRLEALLAGGSRIVVTFFPVARGPTRGDRERQDEQEHQVKKTREEKEKEKEKKPEKEGEGPFKKELIAFKTVAAKWGLSFQYLQDQPTLRRAAVLADPEMQLEPKISWHSALCFVAEQSDWKSVYTCEGQPAVVERAYGSGSLVFCADSYFLSNEAMRKERLPKLLAWLVGPSRVVIFDEESHGVRDDPGIVSLVRKYRLQGAVAGLLLLAVLFVWKNAVPFVPPYADIESGALVTGKDAGEGFVNLLRRSIGFRDILRVCADEWEKSFDHDGRNLKSAHVNRVLASEQAKRDPVGAYRTISRELARK